MVSTQPFIVLVAGGYFGCGYLGLELIGGILLCSALGLHRSFPVWGSGCIAELSACVGVAPVIVCVSMPACFAWLPASLLR